MRIVIIVVLSLLLNSGAHADELAKIKDMKLVHLLNDMEIIAEIKKPPFAVRIIRQLDHGECDGSPETCPMQMMYIATSTFDETPVECVYTLPKAHGWEFLGWGNIPKEEVRSNFVTFRLKMKSLSSSRQNGGFVEKDFEIGANPWKSYMKDLSK